jgi:hypothetical protein
MINNMHPSIMIVLKEKNRLDNITDYKYYICYNSKGECIIYNLYKPFQHYIIVNFNNRTYDYYNRKLYKKDNSYSFDTFNFFKN